MDDALKLGHGDQAGGQGAVGPEVQLQVMVAVLGARGKRLVRGIQGAGSAQVERNQQRLHELAVGHQLEDGVCHHFHGAGKISPRHGALGRCHEIQEFVHAHCVGAGRVDDERSLARRQGSTTECY